MSIVTTPRPPANGKAGSDPGGADDGLDGNDGTDRQAHRQRTTTKRGGWCSLACAGALYAVLSLTVWWNVWSNHPTSTATCGCGDASLFIWFIEWPAYALAHGLNPLYSTALFHPLGINLLSNTSVAAIGIILAPVTWLFGPVGSLNLALTLAPVLSALSAFVLIRRWVSWMPAAFVGGLFYGFSPFIIVNLTNAYLMAAMAAVPPLIVLCLDDLLFRQKRRPVSVGIILGLLVALQFFVGTEALILMGIGVIVGLAVVVVAGARGGGISVPRVRRAAVGLATGSITAAALLAYPTWFALAGPAHLSGPIWPGPKLSHYGIFPKNLVIPTRNTSEFVRMAQRVGGYQGPWLSPDYLGIGALVVVMVGLVLWRRDRRLWFFAAMTAASLALALGARTDVGLPWQLVAGLPLLQNVIPERFIIITYLCVAVMIALIVDHTYRAAVTRTKSHLRRGGWMGGLAGVAVAAVALGPPTAYLSAIVPLATQPVSLPTWFETSLPPGPRPVVLVFPVPYAGLESAMTWQAVGGMRFDMVGGGGPEGVASRDGIERAGQVLFGNATYSQLYSNAMYGPDSLSAMRRALQLWGVTTVVLPDQPGLPLYDRVTSVQFVAALMTAVTGQAPVHRANAWVWTTAPRVGPHPNVTIAALARCASDVAVLQSEGVGRVVSCVRAPPTSPG